MDLNKRPSGSAIAPAACRARSSIHLLKSSIILLRHFQEFQDTKALHKRPFRSAIASAAHRGQPSVHLPRIFQEFQESKFVHERPSGSAIVSPTLQR
ncbi:hypothetical protein M514_03175 [Trichuris suis]|uniref:Uncharacterized protein n=1 Tax=Trichuris suis TaxID=68888 RepID=A0A085MFQ5_9BILA|nr:hypothetical protein M513_03175 [Trichuris suis]KFD65997.1 hypothetical protein M514_03175 [Trichuris suis]